MTNKLQRNNADVSSNVDGGNRIPALDGIRGIAILLVLIHHFTFFSGMRPSILVDKLYYHVAYAGWVGVDLFFVLSGFLITGILYDTKGGSHYFRNFYIRRCLRIFPLYYGFLFIYFFVAPELLSISDTFSLPKENQIWYWTYLTNVKIALDGWPEGSFIGHFWSLAVEEQFYLFWPVIVLLFRRKKLIIVCIVFIAGSLVTRFLLGQGGHRIAAYVLTAARMDALSMGALIALVARGRNGASYLSRISRPAFFLSLFALSIIVISGRGLETGNQYVYTVGFTLLAVLFGAMLLLSITSLRQSYLSRLVSKPGLCFLGRYSYGIYVIHLPIVFLLLNLGLSINVAQSFRGSQFVGLILFSAIAFSLTLGTSLLIWYLLESPFLKIKEHFSYKQESALINEVNP
jgi:peptidoglycan/LPS O-acetylase OafA/YrhL